MTPKQVIFMFQERLVSRRLSLRKEHNVNTILGLVLSSEEVSICLQGLTKGSWKTPFDPQLPSFRSLPRP